MGAKHDMLASWYTFCIPPQRDFCGPRPTAWIWMNVKTRHTWKYVMQIDSLGGNTWINLILIMTWYYTLLTIMQPTTSKATAPSSLSSACARHHMMDRRIKCACLSKTILSNRQHHQHGDEDGYSIRMRLIEVGWGWRRVEERRWTERTSSRLSVGVRDWWCKSRSIRYHNVGINT